MPNLFTIWRRSICAVSGAIAAGIAGLLFGIAQNKLAPTLPWPDALRAALVLGLVGWIAVLMIVGVWLRYGVAATALPALVTSLLAAIVTIYLANLAFVGPFAGWIGLIVGTMVGALLCRACYGRDKQQLRERDGGLTNGMR